MFGFWLKYFQRSDSVLSTVVYFLCTYNFFKTLLFRIKIWDAAITVNVYFLLPITLLSSGSSAVRWGTQQAPWSLSGQSPLTPMGSSFSTSAVPSCFSDIPGQLSRLLVNDLAPDFTGKVGLTDEQSPSPHHKLYIYQVYSIFSIPSFIMEEGPLSFQIWISTWAEPLKEVGPLIISSHFCSFTFQNFVLSCFCEHTNMLWCLSP